MTHNEYWTEVWTKARARINDLFAGCETKVDDIVKDDNFIDSYCDAKAILAFVFNHCPNADEKACAILSVNEALHAWHELQEHATETASQKASMLVK